VAAVVPSQIFPEQQHMLLSMQQGYAACDQSLGLICNLLLIFVGHKNGIIMHAYAQA